MGMDQYAAADMDQLLEQMGEAGVVVLGILAVVLLIVLIISAVMYVFNAWGMYTIAKRRGISNPWLAWIPIADAWLLGSISDQYRQATRGTATNRRILLLALSAANVILSAPSGMLQTALTAANMEPMAGLTSDVMTLSLANAGMSLVLLAVELAMLVFTCMCYYDLFMAAKPDNAVLYLVLGILFGFLMPFFVFACRNRDEGMPRQAEPAPAQLVQPAESVQQAAPAQLPPAAVSADDGPVADESDFADQ